MLQKHLSNSFVCLQARPCMTSVIPPLGMTFACMQLLADGHASVRVICLR